ncbi:MAG: ABC transporter permease [Saprospiraceae bacterium]|nr:ABC transporter permease [Saprospiraceae bacterium]MDW8485057.1 ABC transporter permease [Saprospiraceae bacterium]
MNKLGLIIRREYLTRVRKKSFIIGTLMAPVGLLIYFLVIFYLARYEGDQETRIAVLDEGGMIGVLPDERGIRYMLVPDKSLDELKQAVKDNIYNGILRIPPLKNLHQRSVTIYYYSDEKLAPERRELIENRIAQKIRDFKIDALRIDRSSLENLDTEVSIDPESVAKTDKDESKYTAGIGLAIGLIMAFIMFFMVMMYGQMVMRSVMEEKTNRIVEVMMSSVKPFELMLGKIIGAGAVGLTQVVAWVILGGAVTLLVPLIMDFDPSNIQPPASASASAASAVDPEEAQFEAIQLLNELGKQNWILLVAAFLIFFLGGYFIYASMFAAIGSAMSDDYGEGQSLVLPITIPIVLAFYIVSFVGIRNPDSGLMVFSSLFPLFSPIVMPFRMAYNPPLWQVLLSLALVIASAFFFVWLAGRIYRVGILLYGKKVTLAEIGKWLFYR